MKIPEVLRIEVVHRAGSLAQVLGVVAEAGLLVENLVAVERGPDCTVWELTTELDEDFDSSQLDRIKCAACCTASRDVGPGVHVARGRQDRDSVAAVNRDRSVVARHLHAGSGARLSGDSG